jgi:hypothetical protein
LRISNFQKELKEIKKTKKKQNMYKP